MQVLWGSARPDLSLWLHRRIDPRIAVGPPPGCHHDLHERQVGQGVAGAPGALHRHLAEHIMRFDIFPPWLGLGVLSESPVQRGATVGLHYFLIPHWLAVFFASRVVQVIDEETPHGWRTGFTYQTLTGHPELGEEYFLVTTRPDGSVWVSLSAWSCHGQWYSRLAGPLVRFLQLQAGELAVNYLRQLAQAHQRSH